jgi:hypothetical protein
MPLIFVYGAVMTHAHVLAHGEAAFAEDHAIRFVVCGVPWIEPAFAALEPAPGERAWGVLAAWPDAAWAKVRRRERPYEERRVRVTTASGRAPDETRETREAIALFLTGRRRRDEGAPSARYASLLARGAARFGFPAEVIDRYRRLEAEGSQLTLSLVRWLGARREER